jgi:hypothetical protein
MKTMKTFFLILGLTTTALIAQQQSAQQMVGNNIPAFEHFFAALASSPAVHQQAYLDHIGLSSQSDRRSTLSVVKEFSVQEDALWQQASAALKKNDLSRLAHIRDQRQRLLVDNATQLLQRISSDGVKRINDYFQGVAAILPRRVK